MRRRNVPCSPCSGGSSGSCDCCGIKEKLRILWNRTIGSILRINGITPDGNGDFEIEAGDNIALSQTGTGNGIRIDTTGGVSYYSSGDSYVNVDNNDLEITVNVGTGGLATDTDLQTVAGAVADILDNQTDVVLKSGTLNDGDLLKWDGVNQKIVKGNIPFMNIRFPIASADVQIIPAGVVTPVDVTECDTNDTDNTFFTFSSANHNITINRTGFYKINYALRGLLTTASRIEVACGDQNDVEKYAFITYSDYTGGGICIAGENTVKFNQGDRIYLSAWISAGTMTLNAHRGTLHLDVQYLG